MKIPIFPIAKKIFDDHTPDGAATLPKIINLKGQLKHPVNTHWQNIKKLISRDTNIWIMIRVILRVLSVIIKSRSITYFLIVYPMSAGTIFYGCV
jgi:hypothetical protein